jgi:hypothetical protein
MMMTMMIIWKVLDRKKSRRYDDEESWDPGTHGKRGKDKEALQEGLLLLLLLLHVTLPPSPNAEQPQIPPSTPAPALLQALHYAAGLLLRAPPAGRARECVSIFDRRSSVLPSVRPPTSVAGFRTRVNYFHSSKSSSLGRLQLLTFIHPPTTVAGFGTRVAYSLLRPREALAR